MWPFSCFEIEVGGVNVISWLIKREEEGREKKKVFCCLQSVRSVGSRFLHLRECSLSPSFASESSFHALTSPPKSESEFVIWRKRKMSKKTKEAQLGKKNKKFLNDQTKLYMDIVLNICCFILFLFLFLNKLEEDLDDVMFGKTTRHRPEELKSLERSTKFTRKEIQLIYRGFKQVFFLIYFHLLFKYLFDSFHHLNVHAWYPSFILHIFSYCVCVCADALRDASLWEKMKGILFPFFWVKFFFPFLLPFGVSVEGVYEGPLLFLSS